MNFYKCIATASIIFVSINTSNSQNLQSCESKQQEIESKLNIAIQHNNTYEINGLKKALKENQMHCNNMTLKQKSDTKIKEKEFKIQKLKSEIQLEEKSGNLNKIKKKERKIKELEYEIATLKSR
jgi:G:T/U-mismatch repair DNA glycosylase